MIKLRETIYLILILVSMDSFGATLGQKQIDRIFNSTGGSSLSVPSSGSTIITDTNSTSLSNKTLSGASNTFSQLPIGSQTIQSVVTPYPNGTRTSFTLSTAPPANVAVTLILDGAILVQGTEYTLSGSTITMSVAPATGQNIYAVYSQY